MSLADALRLVLLKERMAQDDPTKGPSELERLAAEFKEQMAKEQEHAQELPGEKQSEKEEAQQDKKHDKEQDKGQGRQMVIEKDWEPER